MNVGLGRVLPADDYFVNGSAARRCPHPSSGAGRLEPALCGLGGETALAAHCPRVRALGSDGLAVIRPHGRSVLGAEAHRGLHPYTTISRAAPRTSISYSSPTIGGRVKCHDSPPGATPFFTISSPTSEPMSCTV